MQDYFKRYAELMMELEDEKATLEEKERELKQISKEYDKTIDLLNDLSINNSNLETEIENEILKMSRKANRKSLLVILPFALVSLIATMGNFNTMMILLLSFAGLFTITNIISSSIIKKWYYKKNSKINEMKEKILENEENIECLNKRKNNLFQERRKANIDFFSQKEIVCDTEEAIENTMLAYATPIFHENVKIRKKTRD